MFTVALDFCSLVREIELVCCSAVVAYLFKNLQLLPLFHQGSLIAGIKPVSNLHFSSHRTVSRQGKLI